MSRPDSRRPIPICLSVRVCLNNKRNTCLPCTSFLPSFLPPLPPQAGSALRALLPVAPSSPLERSSLVLIPRLLVCPAGPLHPVWSDSSWEGYIHWPGAALMVTWSDVSRGCLAGASVPVVSPAGWSPWFSSVQSVGPEESMFIVLNVWFHFGFNWREATAWRWHHKTSWFHVFFSFFFIYTQFNSV